MENITKSPDRLYVSTKSKELVDRLDELEYFGLGKATINRSELFLFVMALGVESGVETHLQNNYTGGLILDKSIDSRTRSIMYAKFLSSLIDPENNLDDMTDKGLVYKMAEQYANTGFEIIEDYLISKKSNDLALDLLNELDDQYKAIADTG